MHSIIGFKTVIGTQQSVYRDWLSGKLEEISSVRTMLPLQKGFDGDSKACLPVAIDYLPTFAFEQGIVVGMPFANSTAVATPFASVIGINNIKRNLLIKASGFKQSLKRIEWNTHNLFVKAFSFLGKVFEIFNTNIRFKLQSHISNIPNNLTKPVLDKVMLLMFKPFKAFSGSVASLICKRLQQFLSFKNLFSFNPNVFSKVGLLKNFSNRGENRNGKALAVDVHSENVFPLRQNRFFFGEESNNLPIPSKSIGLALPPICNKRGKPLEVPILFNGNWQSLPGIHSEVNEEIGFGFKDLAVSRNIELDSNSLDNSSFAFDNISFNIADNLGVEGGVFLAG